MPATYTPIRYPGGKTKLYPIIEPIIDSNGLSRCSYVEPFAGGAGLAIKLLLKNKVSKIVLNDLDRAVFCMWSAIINHPHTLCSMISAAKLTMAEWETNRRIYRNKDDYDDLELGLASFYLNRTNVSGILKGGVIGGRDQRGTFKMDARFTKDTLIRKVNAISDRAQDIALYNLDAVDFLDTCLSTIENPFVYFDPPYVKKGPGLYKNAFCDADHESLARAVSSCVAPWVMTYDTSDLIASLYEPFKRSSIRVGYSANEHRIGVEELIFSPRIHESGFE